MGVRFLMNVDIHTHQQYSAAHHRPGGGFRNVWGSARAASFFNAVKWLAARSFRRKDGTLPEFEQTDPALLAAPPQRLRITWVGHSTTFIQTPRHGILTDPVFSHRASPLSFVGPDRKPALPLRIDYLPGVDAVLISHDHYDHLDERSIKRIQERFSPVFMVPLGVAEVVQRWGARDVVELDWWQYVDLLGIRFHCLPAKHFSGRNITGRDENLWASWYLHVQDAGLRVYYAGDSAYAGHFSEIREHLGAPDVALIPIGAYLPRWMMEPVHMDPHEAIEAFQDLRAGHFLPIHWGTFDLADEPISEPARLVGEEMCERGLSDRFHALPIGGSFMLPE